MITLEEETGFRDAARRSVAMGRDVVMVSIEQHDSVPVFSLIEFAEGTQVVGIVVPTHWVSEEGDDDHCQAILRQETKAFVGEALD